jgi:hypothetical protein
MAAKAALQHVRMEIGFFGGAYSQAEKVITSSHLSNLHILIREAIQNSYDARLPNERPEIEFCFEKVSSRSLECLRTRIFTGAADGVEQLHEDINVADQDWLIISDKGTTGLSGAVSPTMARTIEFETGVASKFYRFFWPAQRPEDFNASDGGTFGVGRNIFSLLSKSKSLVVFTRTSGDNGIVESRLMAMSRGAAYMYEGKLHEGMHFWGKTSTSPALPILGESALEIAEELGLTRFLREGTGTAIAILNPQMAEYLDDFDGVPDSNVSDATQSEVARVIQLWAWPHIVDGTMNFYISNGMNSKSIVEFPALPQLDGFKEAYNRIQTGGENVEPVVLSGRGAAKRKVGLIAYNQIVDNGDDWVDKIIPRQSIALMRKTRHVVKYFSSAQSPEVEPHTAVFVVTDGDADHVFRASEPAAHDEWKEKKQSRDQFPEVPRLVEKTIEFFEDYLARFVRLATPAGRHAVSTGGFEEIAEQFGEFLLPTISTGIGDGEVHPGDDDNVAGGSSNSTRRGNASRSSLFSSKPVIHRFIKFDDSRLGIVVLFPWSDIPTGKNLKININLASRQYADGRQSADHVESLTGDVANKQGAKPHRPVLVSAIWGTNEQSAPGLFGEAVREVDVLAGRPAPSKKPKGDFEFMAVQFLQESESPVSFFCSVSWEQ